VLRTGVVRIGERSTDNGERAMHPADDRSDLHGFGMLLARYLEALALRYRPATVRTIRSQLRRFVAWSAACDLTRPSEVTRAHVEAYQRHLFTYRKPVLSPVEGENGQPLAIDTQTGALGAVSRFFGWLTKEHLLLFNPADDLELPPLRPRLPRAVLSVSEAEAVLTGIDLMRALGLRDRAMLETLYSTGARRSELTRVTLNDLDRQRGTLRIRHGKGGKERMVPIGERALAWIEKYLVELRPDLLERRRRCHGLNDDAGGVLFLSLRGTALKPKLLAYAVERALKAAGITGRGCCHLFRHSAATLMLEGGADIRYIQEMLGHAELSTTEVYTRVSITKLKAIHTATHPAALDE
jgi:integrase/recombinase XerD